MMLWIKTLHIFFVVAWFAALFYLPRIFVNLAELGPEDKSVRMRLLGMAGRLDRFMQPLALLAVGFGLWLWLGYGITGGWMHAKLGLVLVLLGYHFKLGYLRRRLQAGTDTHSGRWFRIVNELPALLLLAIVGLVVLKPF